MPEECPSDFDNLKCVPDHLTVYDRAKAQNLIINRVKEGQFEDARVWLEKVMRADRTSGMLIVNELVKDLTVIEYAQLMAVPKAKYEHVVAEWAGAETQRIDFDQWMKDLDNLVERKFGMSIHDLPDMNFRDAYDDGESPADFLEEDFREALENEGFDVEELLGGG